MQLEELPDLPLGWLKHRDVFTRFDASGDDFDALFQQVSGEGHQRLRTVLNPTFVGVAHKQNLCRVF